MKRVYWFIFLGFLVLTALLWVFFSRSDTAENIKLELARIWSFGTLDNNPLLPGLDRDLTETDYQDSGIKPRVGIDELLGGGPPKDGIPSIDNPQFAPIAETVFPDEELIIGVVIDDQARAYPYSILNWHEIVNDTLAGIPIAVTYCPLCETNTVFKRAIQTDEGEEEVEFGVSGKLFQSCLVMYDRTTDSLFAQPWGIGVVGSQTNEVLERIPATRTTIGAWREKYPKSEVMTIDTGFRRDYTRYPYGTYYTSERIIFPVRNQEARTEHPKEITQIIFDHNKSESPKSTFAGSFKAFTQKEVREAGSISFPYENTTYTALWDEAFETIRFEDENGVEVPNMALFNFVLPAYFGG